MDYQRRVNGLKQAMRKEDIDLVVYGMTVSFQSRSVDPARQKASRYHTFTPASGRWSPEILRTLSRQERVRAGFLGALMNRAVLEALLEVLPAMRWIGMASE